MPDKQQATLPMLEGFCPKHGTQMYPKRSTEERQEGMTRLQLAGEFPEMFRMLCGCTWTWEEKS